jgi:hypothetical protein
MKLLQKLSRLRDRCWPWSVEARRRHDNKLNDEVVAAQCTEIDRLLMELAVARKECNTAKRQMDDTVRANLAVVEEARKIERALFLVNQRLAAAGLQRFGVPPPAFWASHNFDPLKQIEMLGGAVKPFGDQQETKEQLVESFRAAGVSTTSLPVEQPKQETLKP